MQNVIDYYGAIAITPVLTLLHHIGILLCSTLTHRSAKALQKYVRRRFRLLSKVEYSIQNAWQFAVFSTKERRFGDDLCYNIPFDVAEDVADDPYRLRENTWHLQMCVHRYPEQLFRSKAIENGMTIAKNISNEHTFCNLKSDYAMFQNIDRLQLKVAWDKHMGIMMYDD